MDNEQNTADKQLHGNDIFIAETFRRFLFPTILSLLGGTISNFSSGIIVGNLMGENGLAAMGIVTPVFFIFTTLGSLVGVGGATLASVRVGQNDLDGVNRLFTLTLSLMLLLGALASALGMAFLEPLLSFLGAEGEIRDLARDYCLRFIPGAWTTMLIYIPLNFFRITGRPGIGAYMFGIMAIGSIGFSLFFMLPSSLDMGMGGAGLGTVMGTSLALLYSLKGFFEKGASLRLRGFGSELKIIPLLLKTGSPMALTNLLTVLRTLLYNRLLLAVLGTGAVSVFAVLSNVNTFALSVLSGVAQTLAPLTGVFFGERDTQSAKRVMAVASRWGLLLIAAFGAIIAIFWRQVCFIFGLNDPQLFPMARLALSLFAAGLLPAMINNLYQFHYMTIRRVGLANLISVCRCFVLPLLFSFVLSGLRPAAVWGGFPAGELLTIPVFLLCAAFFAKKGVLGYPLLLDERDEREGKAIAFSVLSDPEAVVEASEKISAFCEKNELDPKQSILISLSLEELLISTVEHAFDNRQGESMDVRLLVSGEDVIMRIRNGGREFDPISFVGSNPDNFEECLGIQMIVAGARDVKYTRTLSVNNLTVLI